MPSSSIIKRPLPNAVTYDLSSPTHVTITLPTGSTWSSGLHWHEHHVEFLRIVQGRVRVRLGNTVRTFSATSNETESSKNGAGDIRVDKNTRHEWSRADLDGEDVVVVERTEPADGEKAIFFWNLNGVILEAQSPFKTQDTEQGGIVTILAARLQQAMTDLWLTLNLFVIFRSLDNFPVLMGFAKQHRGVEKIMTHFVLGLAGVLACICRIEPVRREYTPDLAFRRWKDRRGVPQKYE